MNTHEKHATQRGPSCEDDIAVNADFVTALAEDYARNGRGTIEALRLADPARFLMVIALVCFDQRYAGPFADADEGMQHV